MQDGAPVPDHRSPASGLALAALPAFYAAAAFLTREVGGPGWLWFNLDPAYFYLLDAVNVANLTTPAHVYHPGVTVAWLAALILKVVHPLGGGQAVTDAVLADPEFHLRLIGGVFVVVNALAVLAVGIAARRALDSLAAAFLLQAAPFLSMVILKHSYQVKPEALLVATTLALMATAVATLTPGFAERRNRFVVLFGAIAGFGVATKVTALPVFVLPLFVLGGASSGARESLRAVALYGIAAVAALIVFTLPMAGAYDVFVAWMAKVGAGAGAYGSGAGTFVDWVAYPRNIGKLLARPVLHVPLALTLATLAWVAWRRRRGRPLPAPEVRLLAGVAAAQIAQVLLVAKQPNAVYLIPSLMLSALAVVVAWRLWAVAAAEGGRKPVLDRMLAALLAVLLAAQAYAVVRLTGELAEARGRALAAAADARFAGCARVYSYAASSPAFALLLADYLAGSRFSGALAERLPAGVYWLEHWWDQSRVVFRDARGPTDIAQALAGAPCAVFRGTHWATTEPLLRRLMPGLTFDARCRTGDEATVVRGADCDGRPLR